MSNKMENRVSNFFRDRNHINIQRLYRKYCHEMRESENGEKYYFALEENNLAYEAAFTLYQKGISMRLQIQRMSALIKKTEEYLKQINKNTSLA